ncbi:MAG: hypothetical protein R2873_33405 [Caldilineaceae bacterium]
MNFPKSVRSAQSARSAFHFCAAILALLLLARAGSPAAFAQDTMNGLSMDARAAFDGYFKYGEWLPIWVELENQGRDLDAQVQVTINSRNGPITYAAPAELPGGARKRIVLYAPPNSFSRELTVSLVNPDNPSGATWRRNDVTVQPLSAIHFLVGVLTPERGALFAHQQPAAARPAAPHLPGGRSTDRSTEASTVCARSICSSSTT